MAGVERDTQRLVRTYWLERWIGAAGDEKNYNAAGAQPNELDTDSAADCAPFTPAEVRESVGYTYLRFLEIDRDYVTGTSWREGADLVKMTETLLVLEFEIAVPKPADPALDESFMEALEAMFSGLTIQHAGPPWLELRQLNMNPPRRRGGVDHSDQTWRRSLLEIPLRRRNRRVIVGRQEVVLA